MSTPRPRSLWAPRLKHAVGTPGHAQFPPRRQQSIVWHATGHGPAQGTSRSQQIITGPSADHFVS
ncbi:MAG: hypothetical protein ABIK07_14555 [Planctomycetota bacterium]